MKNIDAALYASCAITILDVRPDGIRISYTVADHFRPPITFVLKLSG
jgi:hypothetical protein